MITSNQTVTSADQTAALGNAVTATLAPQPQPERLYTLEQVQAAGGFSRSTLYRLRHGGGLRTIILAGLVRVRENDWKSWLDKNATPTPEAV